MSLAAINVTLCRRSRGRAGFEGGVFLLSNYYNRTYVRKVLSFLLRSAGPGSATRIRGQGAQCPRRLAASLEPAGSTSAAMQCRTVDARRCSCRRLSARLATAAGGPPLRPGPGDQALCGACRQHRRSIAPQALVGAEADWARAWGLGRALIARARVGLR